MFKSPPFTRSFTCKAFPRHDTVCHALGWSRRDTVIAREFPQDGGTLQIPGRPPRGHPEWWRKVAAGRTRGLALLPCGTPPAARAWILLIIPGLLWSRLSSCAQSQHGSGGVEKFLCKVLSLPSERLPPTTTPQTHCTSRTSPNTGTSKA